MNGPSFNISQCVDLILSILPLKPPAENYYVGEAFDRLSGTAIVRPNLPSNWPTCAVLSHA